MENIYKVIFRSNLTLEATTGNYLIELECIPSAMIETEKDFVVSNHLTFKQGTSIKNDGVNDMIWLINQSTNLKALIKKTSILRIELSFE